MIVENINRLCKENNITFCALERRLSIGNGVIGKWGKSGKAPRVDTLKKVADYFGCTVDELLADAEQEGVKK